MRVAAVQAAPVYLDTGATVKKILVLMEEAAAQDADLVCFPETFVSGYPAWIAITDAAKFDDLGQKRAFSRYLDAAVDISDGTLTPVIEAARDLDLFSFLGISERSPSGGSVYSSLLTISPHEGVVGVDRKLKPTFAERLVWADGDGNGLKVHDWGKWKVGGLNCWENWMPLARHTLYSQGEHLHIATWPGTPDITRNISRFIAMEGRVYVLSVSGILGIEHVPDDFPLYDEMAEVKGWGSTGGTMIVAPRGDVIVGPCIDEEKILYADLNLGLVQRERHNFDPSGHYSRPDVFRLQVDTTRHQSITRKIVV